MCGVSTIPFLNYLMNGQKLFTGANGRRFRIQAKDRNTKEIVVLARNLSQADCEAWEPSRTDKQLYVYFRVAYNESSQPKP